MLWIGLIESTKNNMVGSSPFEGSQEERDALVKKSRDEKVEVVFPTKVSVLEELSEKMTDIRRDGNTTRLVDGAIQIILRGDICVVMDHPDMGRNKEANQYLFQLILNRLSMEHRQVIRNIIFDKKELEIRLNDLPRVKPAFSTNQVRL